MCRGIFREDENANTEAVLRVADYVRREVENVLMVRVKRTSFTPYYGTDSSTRVFAAT